MTNSRNGCDYYACYNGEVSVEVGREHYHYAGGGGFFGDGSVPSESWSEPIYEFRTCPRCHGNPARRWAEVEAFQRQQQQEAESKRIKDEVARQLAAARKAEEDAVAAEKARVKAAEDARRKAEEDARRTTAFRESHKEFSSEEVAAFNKLIPPLKTLFQQEVAKQNAWSTARQAQLGPAMSKVYADLNKLSENLTHTRKEQRRHLLWEIGKKKVNETSAVALLAFQQEEIGLHPCPTCYGLKYKHTQYWDNYSMRYEWNMHSCKKCKGTGQVVPKKK